MSEYRVKWEIDLEADSPREAAEEALRIHRNPESIATVFEVENRNCFRARDRDPVTIDLSENSKTWGCG